MTTATAPTLADLTGTYTLDPAHTRIGFVARHAMVTKVRGAFNEFEISPSPRRSGGRARRPSPRQASACRTSIT